MLRDVLMRARKLLGLITSTISTSTYISVIAYSNQKKACVLSTGRMIAMFPIDSGATGAVPFWSDDGVTWTNAAPGSPIGGWENGSIASYVDSGGTERLVVVWKQVGTTGGRIDKTLYVMVGTFNANRTAITWGAASVFYAAAATTNFPDLVAAPEGTGGVAHLVVSDNSSSPTCYAMYKQVNIDASGAITSVGAQVILGGNYAVDMGTYPSIDMDRATKRLFVAWSAGTTGTGKGIRFRTASYSAGAWTWAAEVEVNSTVAINGFNNMLVCRWDGTRVVIGGKFQASTGTWIWDSTNFTAFTARISTVLAEADAVYGIGMAVHPNGDVYLFGTGYNGTQWENINRYKVTRSGATLTLGPKLIIETYVSTSNVWPSFVNAWYAKDRIHSMYGVISASPYNVKYRGIDA